MSMDRRTFLQTAGAAGAAGAGLALGQLFGCNLERSVHHVRRKNSRRCRVTTTVCPYCAVGCGALVYTHRGRVISVEGDPDHPINEGTLCAKGTAMGQIVNNPRRLTQVLYRAPGASAWQVKDWDWALGRIARRIQQTRDATFVKKDAQGRRVNRTEGIACLGGAALDNEECYLYAKLSRALGVVYLEHQARI